MEQAPNLDGSGLPPRSWRRDLAAAIRDRASLLAALGLPDDARGPPPAAADAFPLLVPHSFVRRMRPGDPRDPLLLQVLPTGAEDEPVAGFDVDPVGDIAGRGEPGVIHKYDGRALVVATGVCAVHCRYCFRRHFPYAEAPRGRGGVDAACTYAARDTSVREVILSGGDPLLQGDATLRSWSERLAAIPHVTRLRVHTRLPIVLPSRVDAGLLEWLAASRAHGPRVWMVVHANHPNEIADDAAEALHALVSSGTPVLNQAVLLRGVNDDADVLVDLSERLADLGVQPYYLNQLDRVAGAAHFQVADERGRELVAAMRRRLPGYAVPRFVRDVPGEASKTEV